MERLSSRFHRIGRVSLPSGSRGVARILLSLILGVAPLFISCAPQRPVAAGPQSLSEEPEFVLGSRRLGESWVRRIGPAPGLLLGRFSGPPYPLGVSIGRLCRSDISSQEAHLERLFGALMPSPIVRWSFKNLFAFRLRKMDRAIAPDLLTMLAGVADGYEPDTPPSAWPAYRRLLGLHAVHEVSQRFVDAPYLQSYCTGFAAAAPATRDGVTLLARNFDFEGGALFDRDKIVSVVAPAGKIAYLSVGFPGMIGVVSGFNSAGIGVAIQSIAGGETADVGEPTTLLVADLLQNERSFEGAVERIRHANVFVSDIFIVADAKSGRIGLVEKTPSAFSVRESGPKGWIGVTNEARDPEVRRHGLVLPLGSTSRKREERLEALLKEFGTAGELDVGKAVRILRDHRSPAGVELGPGNRNAINAFIAAHSVVFDLTHRRAWVATAPHVLGAYVAVDLDAVLASHGDRIPQAQFLPADADLSSGLYDRYLLSRRALQRVRFGRNSEGPMSEADVLNELQGAHELTPDFVEVTLRLAECFARSGERERALVLLEQGLAHEPSPEPMRKGAEALRDALLARKPLPAERLFPSPRDPDELIEESLARDAPSSGTR